MNFDWNDFRLLAENLGNQENEASKRTAISRIYYAVYHQAKILLEEDGFIFRQTESSHLQVWEAYRYKGRTHRAIGLSGKVLRDNRVKADYLSEIADIEQLTEDSFQIAEKISTYLQQIQNKQ
jgi:uncharacterized protein (UPF0332 family)